MRDLKGKTRFLEGERVYLIPIEEEYIDEYSGKLKNASFDNSKNTGSKIIVTKSTVRNYVNNICSDNSRVDFFIVNKENDDIIGEVVLNSIDWKNRSANIRIAIFEEKDYNKKYGTQSMLLALDFGFGMYNLHRIELQVYPFNKRAVHVYKKLGFKEEGVLRDCLYFDNQYHDAIAMSILKDEFKV